MPYKNPADERARQLRRRQDPEYRRKVHERYLRRKITDSPEKKARILERQKAWARKHPERCKAARDRYHQRNPDAGAKACSKWQKANKDKVCINTRRRKARKRAAVHPQMDWVKERACFDQAQLLTRTTGQLYTVDHIIPILLGGWHHHDNLQVMPNGLNSQKNHDPFWEKPGYKCWRDVPGHLWPEKLVPAYRALLI